MSSRLDRSWLVLASHQTFEADRCVDIFQRPEGTFGFEEFRRDPEDMGAWTPVHYFSGREYLTEADALDAACQAVPWLASLIAPDLSGHQPVGVIRLPIACSLTADDAGARVEEWRHFVNHRVVEIARSEGGARLRLEDGEDALLFAADLARREKACCPFFEFRLVLHPDAVWLEVEGPDDAAVILDALIDLQAG